MLSALQQCIVTVLRTCRDNFFVKKMPRKKSLITEAYQNEHLKKRDNALFRNR